MPYSTSKTFYTYLNPDAAKVIVFFHGLGSSHSYYYLIASVLSTKYGCLLLDNPGAGKSELEGESVSIKEIGSNALQIIEELGIADKKFVLVGHSMSGMVVNYLAADTSHEIDITACVLISPVHPVPGMKPVFEQRIETIKSCHTLEGIAEAVSKNAPGAACSNLKRAFIRQLVLSLTPEGYIANCAAIVSSCSHTEEFLKYYAKVTVPVLLILGAEDKTAPYEGCSKIIEDGLANSTTCVLEGVGHWSAVESDERVLAEIERFIV